MKQQTTVAEANLGGSAFIGSIPPFVGRRITPVRPSICRLSTPIGIRGFTLIELIITLTIIGILTAFAIPNMASFLQSNSLTAVTNDLLHDLSRAKNEAVKRGVNVGVCKSSDGATCTGAPSTWNNGWITFVDADNSGTWTQTAGNLDERLRTHEAVDAKIAITSASNLIVYNRQALLTPATATSYTLCNSTIGKSRQLQINIVGRVALSEGTCP